MNNKRSMLIGFGLAGTFTLLSISTNVNAHGLIESPSSRSHFCGVITKPHEIGTGEAEYPECAEAFDGFDTQGYSFMSILTHHRGRLRPLPPLPPGATPPANESGGVEPPLATNVCSYDSESFDGNPTVWDQPIDWPTNKMSSGRNLITWNISWGSHFNDTEQFHYWITKPNFQYQVGVPLTWDDFEAQPFCKLDFDRNDQDANPDIVVRLDDAKFDTYCDVPERDGRHVIYGEWGRNKDTWERFHGCIDVVFGDTTDVIDANISVLPSSELKGLGSVTLDGSNSVGEGLSYEWKVESQTTDAEYTIDDSSAQITTLSYTDPSSTGSVTVQLNVSTDGALSAETVTLEHEPQVITSNWIFEQSLTSAQALSNGTRVSIRAVLEDGTDLFLPNSPLVIADGSGAADTWPLALAQAVNSLGGVIQIGVLNGSDQIVPEQNATANNIYSKADADVTSVFLQIETAPSDVDCSYQVSSQWDNGFQAKILLTNVGSSDVDGWSVDWSYTDSTVVNQVWNAILTGNYTASNQPWNATISPGETVEIGMTGVKGSASAQVPTLSGDTCQQ